MNSPRRECPIHACMEWTRSLARSGKEEKESRVRQEQEEEEEEGKGRTDDLREERHVLNLLELGACEDVEVALANRSEEIANALDDDDTRIRASLFDPNRGEIDTSTTCTGTAAERRATTNNQKTTTTLVRQQDEEKIKMDQAEEATEDATTEERIRRSRHRRSSRFAAAMESALCYCNPTRGPQAFLCVRAGGNADLSRCCGGGGA